MSSGNFKDLTPDDNYASVELTGDSIVLPPDAEDVILVVEGDSSISGTVNVELEHSNDNVNFTTAKNKPLTTGAGGEPAAPTIEAYFSRIPNPRLAAARLSFLSGSGQNQLSSIYLGELILNAMDASNPNGTYRIEIVGPNAQYVEFRATNENARTSYLDHFENENLDTSDAAFTNVQDTNPSDPIDHMSYESVSDYTSPQPYLAFTNGGSSENKYNVSLKLRDSSHQMQQGHVITGINYKNKVELHTRANDGNYSLSYSWLASSPMSWGNNFYHMNADRGINISIIITPEFGANPQPVTISYPYVIRGVPTPLSTVSALPHTASIGDTFGTIGISTPVAFFVGLPALTYEVTCHDSRIALSGSTLQAGGTPLTATLNTSNFSPFGGLSIAAPISVKEPTKGLTSFDDSDATITFTINANALSVTAGTVTSPANNAALGTDVCSVSVAGGLGTESITLSVAGTDASYYRLNNVTAGTTGSTITATSTDTVVLETNQAFSFSGYSHSVDIEASFTDSYGTYTDSVTGISISQAGYTLTSNVSSVDEGNTFTIDLNTLGTTAGDTVAYTITGVDSADINGASLTGNFTLSGNLDDSITFTATADATTEGAETFTLSLDNGQSSVSVTINDTSTSAPAGFSNEYYLEGPVVSTQQDDYSINGTEKSLFPSKGGGSNYFPTLYDEWSLSFWLKAGTSPGSYVPIFQMINGNTAQIKMYNAYLTYNAGGNARSFRATIGTASLFTGDWVHVVITKSTANLSASSLKVYVDGSLISISVTSNTLAASDYDGVAITKTTFGGALYSAVSGNFLTRSAKQINIDQIKSFDTELTSTQVTELYNLGTPIATSDLSFASNIDAEFLCGDGANDNVAGNQSYDIQDNTRYIEKVGTGTFGISQLTSSDSIYVAFPAFSNTKAIESTGVWTLSGGDINGVTMPTGRIGAYQNLDSTKHLFGGANANGEFSVSFWINSSGTPSPTGAGHKFFNTVLINNSNTTESVKFGVMQYTNNRLYTNISGVAYDANYYTGALTHNVWRHVVVTFENSATYAGYYVEKMYVNGVYVGGSGVLNKLYVPYLYDMTGYTNYGFAINSAYDAHNADHAPYSTTNTTDMRMDDFATFSKALSQSEITAIYNSGVPTDLTGHSGIEHWFRMGDGANDTGTSIACEFHSSTTLTSTTDYSLTLTSSDTIYKP